MPLPATPTRALLRSVRLRLALGLFALGVGALFAIERGVSAEPRGCRSCHVMERYVDGFTRGRNLDAAHARAAVSCTDCHQGYTLPVRAATGLAYIAGVAGMPGARRYDDALCNRCHVGMEHQAARTDFLARNPHRSHWPELGCADCHPAHAPQVDFCSQCHDSFGHRMTGAPPRPRLLPAPPWLLDPCRAPGECRAP